jgi:citrate lyase subunit beta/citryl-CoA lyase
MRRSLLFIPGNSPAMLQNADIFSADSVIFDLEDAVVLPEKDAARNLVESFLDNNVLANLEIVIRINSLDARFSAKDLEKIVSDKIDTIMLPKASVKNIIQLSFLLSKYERKRKMEKRIQIIPIIESASAIWELNEIASFSRVNGLLLGAEDLATDMEIARTEEGMEIFYARSAVVMASKAYKIDAIDTPYTNTKNDEGLEKDSKRAKMLGMNAKACIHPNQIDPVNRFFSPEKAEIEYAKKVIQACEEAKKEGKGAFSVDGKMIDKPVIDRAYKLIEKAEKWGVL